MNWEKKELKPVVFWAFEGSKTEHKYFEQVKELLKNIAFNRPLRKGSRSTPEQVVSSLNSSLNLSFKEAMKDKEGKAFAVVDEDEHDFDFKFPKRITLVVIEPRLEYWLHHHIKPKCKQSDDHCGKIEQKNKECPKSILDKIQSIDDLKNIAESASKKEGLKHIADMILELIKLTNKPNETDFG